MKKVLFASTALVAFAGAASAEVTITGNAEAGLFGQDGETFVITPGAEPGDPATVERTATDIDAQFFTDVDVTFTMSGETDNGLAFGASIDLDEGGSGAAAVADDQDDGGVAVFLTGAFGTLTIGDTDGALDWALTEVAFNSGSINDAETDHTGYNGNAGLDGFGFGTFTGGVDPDDVDEFEVGGGDGQILRYDYSIGDFGFAVSAEQVSTGVATVDGTSIIVGDADANQIDGTILGVGVKFDSTFAGFDFGIGLGYQRLDSDGGDLNFDADAYGASINSGFGDFNFGVSYLEVDVDDIDVVDGADVATFINPASYDHFGVGLGYGSGPIQASINYGRYDYDDGTEADGFGVSAGYDLGGGAVIQAGYGDSDLRGDGDFGGDRQSYSLGVRLNF